MTVGGEKRVAGSDGSDRGDQLLRWIVLQDEPASAGLERFVDVLLEAERRQDQDPGRFIRREDASRGLETVEVRHPDVHQGDAGREARRLLDGFEAVFGLGDDLDPLLVLEQHPEARADHRLIVGDEDADGHHTWLSRGKRVLSAKPRPGTVSAVIVPP